MSVDKNIKTCEFTIVFMFCFCVFGRKWCYPPFFHVTYFNVPARVWTAVCFDVLSQNFFTSQ